MDKKKSICRCPLELQSVCKVPLKGKPTDLSNPKDPGEIARALKFENYIDSCTKPKPKRSKQKKPKHGQPLYLLKEPCVPMKPSMYTRLRYIGHCDQDPEYLRQRAKGKFRQFKFGESEHPDKKRVTYKLVTPGEILLPKPTNVVRHSTSSRSILNVPSPNTSGTVIRAERAAVKPSVMRPPLPPKSGHELFKPRSGIYLNKDSEFVPSVVRIPGFVDGMRRPERPKPCYKGGICGRRRCRGLKNRTCPALQTKKASQRMKGKGRSSSRRSSHKYKDGSASVIPLGSGRPSGSGRQSGAGYRAASGFHPGAGNRPGSGKRTGSEYRAGAGSQAGARNRPGSQHPDEQDDDSVCLDQPITQEHVQIPKDLKRGSLRTHSLTVVRCNKDKLRPDIHYGILTGSFNMYNTKFSGRSRGRQALTMSVMAYCLAFHYHPKQWTMKLIDNLVDAGDVWYSQCLDKVHDHSAVQGICEVLPFGKKQILVLNGKRMQVLLSEPDIVGYTMSLDPTVYNLCRGLKAFFKENRAGILLSRVLKLVIWKDRVCFYLFDPAGRDSRAYSNYANGQAALINVKDIHAVADVLLARSVLQDQKYVLAPIKILKIASEKCDEDFESEKELTQAEKAMMGYRILTETCAIVNANMHLGDRCFEEAKFRQQLPVAIVAMTYAKISPPNTWFSKTLDKILRLGNKLYIECTYPKVMIDITIDNIPNEIMLGPYACEIIIYRERVKGQLFTTKECLFNINRGLAEFFSHEYNCGILEFNNYMLAIWRQKDMFYLFDPYPRTTDGLRSMQPGKACCLMLLNAEAMANAIRKNWDYLPTTTQFYVHGFKVLKVKKKQPKVQLLCRLSDTDLPGPKKKKKVALPMSKAQGDGRQILSEAFPAENSDSKEHGLQKKVDEEQMGDIISLVESIQEDYVPPVPMRYKNVPPEPMEPKVVNLDSPTVSVTQVVPPWPKPRDKTNEPIEPDPDPEPTPPPTPPPPVPPEGGFEEEEERAEEEEDEEMIAERLRKKAEEEEARRKAEELPPPLPPPPPSPQPEDEVPLAPAPAEEPKPEDELQAMPAVNVDRRVLLTEDAQRRSKLRKIRTKMTHPLKEDELEGTPEHELEKPSNFSDLPDATQIIRGTKSVSTANEAGSIDKLPFGAIMAIVTSYKYGIHTWTPGIVDYVVLTASKLYSNKEQKFQLAPVHIIPKIALGHQAYHANVDVVGEGASWQMEDVLSRKFFNKYDRGVVTTSSYSCAVFKKNGLYYLFDGSTCDAMGLRDDANASGKACFLRFQTLADLVSRINYNKGGKVEDQQFILSRIVVRQLLKEARTQLPEDHDYETGKSKSTKSKQTILESDKDPAKRRLHVKETRSEIIKGYQLIDGMYKIEGTTALNKGGDGVMKSCHFVCLTAMLMAAMHRITTWDHLMVDICIEKGLEIHAKATKSKVCEKRVIKNLVIDGKLININIQKILVVNENKEKKLEQYLKAVLGRLRYVILRFPTRNIVICQTEGYFHLFDPYPAAVNKEKTDTGKPAKDQPKKGSPVATWTLFPCMDGMIKTIRKLVSKKADSPEFYTFELTSVKPAPRQYAYNYRLSPLFKPDINPNIPYLKLRKMRPVVDEKMYWLNMASIPWSRMNKENDLGLPRKTPRTMWKSWDIEFPGDLYSLWGTIHPLDKMFCEHVRGLQYLATSAVAIGMTRACKLNAWTSGFLDGIVIGGNDYHIKCFEKLASKPNYELSLADLNPKCDEIFPFSFSFTFDKIVFGFVYNALPDRFNLSKALVYFFENEKNQTGILTSSVKNLAFGKAGSSYFMFDCQSFGAPIFCPGQGASYILKCESLNRLIYCMTITMNVRRHGQEFHLFNVTVKYTESSKKLHKRENKDVDGKQSESGTSKSGSSG